MRKVKVSKYEMQLRRTAYCPKCRQTHDIEPADKCENYICCRFDARISTFQKSVKVPWCEGFLHQWGLDVDDGEGGPASYSVAIVERSDGSVITPSANMVKFILESNPHTFETHFDSDTWCKHCNCAKGEAGPHSHETP
jgi:hypothetical protein